MPLVRYEIQSELALANRDLYRTAPKNDPEAILEGVAMVGLVGIVRQLGDLAEFAADVFHDLHEALLATAARSHDLVSRVSQLEGELGAVEKSTFSKKTNHLQFAYAPGLDWRATVPTDQNPCTQGDLPRFIRSAYEACRGPPKLFLLDKFDVQGAGACLKRYTDPSFFKMEWASSEIMKAERAQRQKKARRGKKARGRKDSEARDVKPTVHLQPGLRRTLSRSSVDDASENIMSAKSIPSNTTEENSHQRSSETSAIKSPKSVRRFGFPKPASPITSLSRNSELYELKPKPFEEDGRRGSTDAEQYLDAMTNMDSEADLEPLERRRFYDGFKRTRTGSRKSDHDGDVLFEDARNSTMESETESKYSVELTPIPVDPHLEFEDEAVDGVERTGSEHLERELDESGSRKGGFRMERMDQDAQASDMKQRNEEEISQDRASTPHEHNDFVDIEQSGPVSGSMHAEAGNSTGGPTNDPDQLQEDSARKSAVESLHHELMEAGEAEDNYEVEDDEQFDVELLRVIGYNSAEAKPEVTVAETDRDVGQQAGNASLAREIEAVKETEADSPAIQMEAAGVAAVASPEAFTQLTSEDKSASTLKTDEPRLQEAEKYFSLDSNFEDGELVRQGGAEKQKSGASSASGMWTSLDEAVVVEKAIEENVPLVDEFESSSSEDVFMDADAGYQSSSRFSDADYNFGDASSEQFEQMEGLSGRIEELPSSMQITPDKDDDLSADQPVYYDEHDAEEQVPETSEAVLEKQPHEQALDQEALIKQQQPEQIAERNKEAVLEQQRAEQESIFQQPAEQIDEERIAKPTQSADQGTEQLIEEGFLGHEPALQIPEHEIKEAAVTGEQIADRTPQEATTGAELVAEQTIKEAIEEQVLQQRTEPVVKPRLRDQAFELEQRPKDAPRQREQVQQSVKRTESPTKDLSSPVSSVGSPLLPLCPETVSKDAISFKFGTLSLLSPPDVSSESSSSPSSSSSSSPRSPVFSALRAPLSPTQRASNDEGANIETFLAPSSPTSTSGLPSYQPWEPREMPPLPPLPPLRWLTALPPRDSQHSRASPSLSTPMQADEADVSIQQNHAQTEAPVQQMQQDAPEAGKLMLQHADAPTFLTSLPVHSREVDVGANAQQPPVSDDEDEDVPELEIPQAAPELEIPEHKMPTSPELPHLSRRGLLETQVAERRAEEPVPASDSDIQEGATKAQAEVEIPELDFSYEVPHPPQRRLLETQVAERQTEEPVPTEAAEVPELKASHPEVQEAVRESLPERETLELRTSLEVPHPPEGGLLETQVAERQDAEQPLSTEASGVPDVKASHPEVQEAVRESLPERETLELRTSLEVPHPPEGGLVENRVAGRQDAEQRVSTEASGVPDVKASPQEIQEKVMEAPSELEIPEPDLMHKTRTSEEVPRPPQREEVEQRLSAEAAGVPELELSRQELQETIPETQETRTKASPAPEVALELSPEVLENELEVTLTPLQGQEPGFSAAEKEMIQQALKDDHSGQWRMAMQLEYDALKMKMGIKETSQQAVEPAVAGSAEVEVIELETSAEELEQEIGEVDATEEALVEEKLTAKDLSESVVSELPAASDVLTIPDSQEQVMLKQVALGETEPTVITVEEPEELQRLETRNLVDENELTTDSKQSPVEELKEQLPVFETPETEDELETQLSMPANDENPFVLPAVPEPTVEVPEPGVELPKPNVELQTTLPVSTMPLRKETGDDPLIKAVSQHDKSKLKKVPSDLRPPPRAPDERDSLLEQIRSQSFNLRQTTVEKEKPEVRQQPRILSNINVAAILEKANAIRQAFVGSDDDEDDDWSDS